MSHPVSCIVTTLPQSPLPVSITILFHATYWEVQELDSTNCTHQPPLCCKLPQSESLTWLEQQQLWTLDASNDCWYFSDDISPLHKHIHTCTQHLWLLGPLWWTFWVSSLIQSGTVTHLSCMGPPFPVNYECFVCGMVTAVEQNVLSLHWQTHRVELLATFICTSFSSPDKIIPEYKKSKTDIMWNLQNLEYKTFLLT